MTRLACTLMTEQSGPRALVEHAVDAERAGFELEVMSEAACGGPGGVSVRQARAAASGA